MREIDDELVRGYRRWRAMEDAGREDEADAAFGRVFREASGDVPVLAGFPADTMAAVASAVEQDAQRARRTRKVLVPVGTAAAAVLLYVGGGFLVSAMATAVMWAVNLAIGSIVGVATNAEAGVGVWSVARSLGRAAASFASSPVVTISIIAIQGVAMAALIALQRLLGSDGEFYR
jgi:hypothetical protein